MFLLRGGGSVRSARVAAMRHVEGVSDVRKGIWGKRTVCFSLSGKKGTIPLGKGRREKDIKGCLK